MAKKESGAGTGSASTTTYVCDELGRLTSVKYANGHTVAYSYDAVGNRTSVRAGVGVAVEAPTPPVATAEPVATPAPKSQAPRKLRLRRRRSGREPSPLRPERASAPSAAHPSKRASGSAAIAGTNFESLTPIRGYNSCQ